MAVVRLDLWLCECYGLLSGPMFSIEYTVSIDCYVCCVVRLLLVLTVLPFICIALKTIVIVVGIFRLLLTVVMKGLGYLDVRVVGSGLLVSSRRKVETW